MDLWVVAAAAGAGYLTKYWQKLSRDNEKDSLLRFSNGDANHERSEAPRNPLRVQEGRKSVSKERFSDINLSGSVSQTEVASTSGYDGERLGSLVRYQDCNVLSLSNIPPVYPVNTYEIGDESRNDLDLYSGGLLPKSSHGERGSFHVPPRYKRSYRAEHSYGPIVKPQSSLQSCLMAQLHKKCAETENSVLNLPSPSTSSMRPLFVTDGSQIISGANDNLFSSQIINEENKLHKEDYLERNDDAYRVPPLPKLDNLDLPKKAKIKTRKGQNGRSSISNNIAKGKHLHSEDSLDGVVLLCLGISIGVISSFIANKKEVDKLKDVLKQTENLVEDLQEELEMKDKVTVKELNENYVSQDARHKSTFKRALNPSIPKHNMDHYDDRDLYEQKAEESSDMSKIETELEAELEMLGLNMNTSTLDGRLTDLAELDPHLMADFAQGELRAEMVGGYPVTQPESSENASSASTAHQSANYAVSPRALSLRLHEVIQSRLEERIQELEAALQSSHRKDLAVEFEHKECLTDIPNCYVHSTIQESTDSKEQCQNITEPLVMNLSGEALDAYNEAYEEMLKLSESEDEDSPCQVFETFRDQISSHNDGLNGSTRHFTSFKEGKWSREERNSKDECSNSSSVIEETIDSDAEMERELIKQIVEQTKKGSPVVLNAQRWLFLTDEDEKLE